MDKIYVYDELGNEEEKEVVLLLETIEKNYILYKDINSKNKKIYASYFYKDDLEEEVLKLNNNLTEEEYKLLEEAYKKGRNEYDREK